MRTITASGVKVSTAAILATAAFALWGCGSGSGCGDTGAPKQSEEKASVGGTGGNRGGLGEAVSFQGTKMKPAPAILTTPPGGAPPRSAPTAVDQSVICGGFPGLAGDCMNAPEFAAIRNKCCPTGRVETCRAIPGGARLTGQGCTAAPR